jgi:hypothetical protein
LVNFDQSWPWRRAFISHQFIKFFMNVLFPLIIIFLVVNLIIRILLIMIFKQIQIFIVSNNLPLFWLLFFLLFDRSSVLWGVSSFTTSSNSSFMYLYDLSKLSSFIFMFSIFLGFAYCIFSIEELILFC